MTASRPTPDHWPVDSYGLRAATEKAQAALLEVTRVRREIAVLRTIEDSYRAERRR